MASVAMLWDLEVVALCEDVLIACKGSYAGLFERGLGSLPGGDESELVSGVRTWSDVD